MLRENIFRRISHSFLLSMISLFTAVFLAIVLIVTVLIATVLLATILTAIVFVCNSHNNSSVAPGRPDHQSD